METTKIHCPIPVLHNACIQHHPSCSFVRAGQYEYQVYIGRIFCILFDFLNHSNGQQAGHQ